MQSIKVVVVALRFLCNQSLKQFASWRDGKMTRQRPPGCVRAFLRVEGVVYVELRRKCTVKSMEFLELVTHFESCVLFCGCQTNVKGVILVSRFRMTVSALAAVVALVYSTYSPSYILPTTAS